MMLDYVDAHRILVVEYGVTHAYADWVMRKLLAAHGHSLYPLEDSKFKYLLSTTICNQGRSSLLDQLTKAKAIHTQGVYA